MSQRSRGGFSFSISARISSASAGDLGAVARQRQDLARPRPRPRRQARHRRRPTRARVSAMCSQVQASSRWYFLNASTWVATGPLLPDGRKPKVELVEHALGGRRRHRRDQALRHARVIVRRRERLRRRRILRHPRRDRRAGSGRRRSRPSARGCRACPCRGSPPCRRRRGRGGARTRPCTASSAAPMVRSARSEKALPARAAIDRAGKQPDADQEFLLGGEDAQPVEHVLVGRRRLRGRPPAAPTDRRGPAVRRAAPDRAARRRHAGGG